ncbi:MAG: SH3 domain-containing protein [Candidatus Muirbacterium halophilum]|nr:SH3 domain-containing protein [Candidatus Muirbacterium halophilum]MCK9476655.1 SH3 domain-containing protein [Candidatus Muirbacterium halophilum]
MRKSIGIIILFFFLISFVNAADLNEKIDFLKEKALELNGTGRATTRFEQGDEDADDGDVIFDVLDYIQKMHNEFPDVLDDEKVNLLNTYINEMGRKYKTFSRSGGVVSKDELYEYLLEDLEKIVEDIMMESEYSEEISRNIDIDSNRNAQIINEESNEEADEEEAIEEPSEEDSDIVAIERERISYGKVIARNGAYMRKGPSTSYSKIMGVGNGTKVKILETTDSWYYVELNNTRGYIYKTLIEITEVTDEVSDDEDDNDELNGTIKVTKANVRRGPGTNHLIAVTLKYGDNVKITGKSGSWLKIEYNGGKPGYIHSNLVFIDEDESSLGKGRVNVSSARVRKGPSTSYGIITNLRNGDIVDIVKEANSSWYYIKMENGKYGYTSKRLISSINANDVQDDDDSNTTNNNSKKQAYISVNRANIRKGPGTNTGILTTLLRGTVVNVIKEDDSWTNIKLNDGRVGYVYSSLISNEESAGASISSGAARITRYALGAVNNSNVIYGVDCYTPATANGKLACAAVVSAILKRADVGFRNVKIYCPYLRDYLTSIGFKTVTGNNWKKGDVVFWTKKRGDRPRHVGIVVQKDVYGKWWAVDNSTARLKVLKRPLLRSYYPVVLPGRRI